MSHVPSNKEWLFWGRADPLFGVATRPGRQRGGANPWTVDEFLEMGRAYFTDVWKQWVQFGVTGVHCVEIGCGAGRITRQLAQRFEQVTAVDVSPDQLALAAKLLGELSEHVTLACVVSPAIPLPDASSDAIFSCEVFQHLDSDEPFEAYVREAWRVLRPGGTICFHVPVRGQTAKGLLASPVRNAMLRALRRVGRRRMMMYRVFEPERVVDLLTATGFVDVEMRIFRAGDERPAYFFARKP